jgi:signal transduction histidine kinase
MSANDPLRPLAVMAKTAAERGAALISKLLLFARRQPLQVRAVNINDTLVDMEDLLRRTLSANISVRQLLDDRVGETLIDPTQFEAAILNLCINARDAMPNGGKLTIETIGGARNWHVAIMSWFLSPTPAMASRNISLPGFSSHSSLQRMSAKEQGWA